MKVNPYNKIKSEIIKLDVIVHTFNLHTWKAEASGLWGVKGSLICMVTDQPVLPSDIMSP